jgi:hypothetical protein
MRNSTLVYLFLFLFCACASAQQAEKTWFDKADSVYGYYVTIQPPAPAIQGAVVLFDGYGGNADGFFAETKIPNVARANELLTVCIPTGMRLYMDKPYIQRVNTILSVIAVKYKLRKDQFAIGGMSSGGTIALRYAELCHESPAAYPILPKAVFDVDSPLDLEELYRSAQRDIKKKYDGFWISESHMIVDTFDRELGDINGDLKKYRQVSPFAVNATEPGNEKWLKETAVRTYHDVDVNWYLLNRRRSLYEMNSLPASEMINRLLLSGNDKAEFISSKIEGRRPNGQRHPHSWNIVDEAELIQWIKKNIAQG